MGRGLGPKQQELLSWLQQQWAADIQPKRDELMGTFVTDKHTIYQWDRKMQSQLESQLIRQGVEKMDAYLQAGQEARNHPERPELTPRPVAEAYRRALRTLVDRELVKVVTDGMSYYRYCDPEADNPLAVSTNAYGHEAPYIGTESGRRREPEVSASEQRRQALLQCLPADGNWMGINDLTDAFYLAIGGQQETIDGARALLIKSPWQTYRLLQTNAYKWLREALLQLQKAGKVEAGTIAWNGTELEPKRYPQEKVLGARLCVAQ